MNWRGTRLPVFFFLASVVAAALAPLAGGSRAVARPDNDGFPGWPARYEGHALEALPLTRLEEIFARDFPGRTGRFRDSHREIIVRWVTTPTRRLHSAAECFRGNGYRITPLPARKDDAGRTMGCFRARSASDDLAVCEIIIGNDGRSWPDVSAWYWHMLFAPNASSWWSYVVAEEYFAAGHAGSARARDQDNRARVGL
ncbi:MAG: hypothetical protein ACKVQA_25445 [Burkholderiales bacterium]